MGFLDDLVDKAVDAGKDLLSDGASGLFGGGDEGGGLLESALGTITGGDDGGGLLGGLLGGGDGGGPLGGMLGETATGMLGGMFGGDGGDGGSGGFLGGLLDDAGGVVESVTSAVGDGSWSDSLGGIVDQWTGGGLGGMLGGEGGLGGLLGGEGGGALGGLLGGEGGLGGLLGGEGGLGGITNQIAEFLPPGLSDAAGSIVGGDGNWAGSLLDQVTGEISDQIPDEWTSVADSILGSGLGEAGFDDWVDQGLGALGSLGVPEGLGGIIPDKQWFGLEPGGIAGYRPPTEEELEGRLKDLLLGTEEQPGNTGIVPPDLQGGDGDDGPVTSDDLDLELDVEDGGDVAVDPAPADDLGLDDGAGSGSEPDLPAGPETADVDPGADDVEMAPTDAPVAAEPAPVEAPEPAPEPVDEFDQAIGAADEIESSTDELFEGLE
ncbi:MAG TPA: hypothetical protein VFZ68_11090 [Acidimicrobiales bacterium]